MRLVIGPNHTWTCSPIDVHLLLEVRPLVGLRSASGIGRLALWCELLRHRRHWGLKQLQGSLSSSTSSSYIEMIGVCKVPSQPSIRSQGGQDPVSWRLHAANCAIHATIASLDCVAWSRSGMRLRWSRRCDHPSDAGFAAGVGVAATAPTLAEGDLQVTAFERGYEEFCEAGSDLEALHTVCCSGELGRPLARAASVTSRASAASWTDLSFRFATVQSCHVSCGGVAHMLAR